MQRSRRGKREWELAPAEPHHATVTLEVTDAVAWVRLNRPNQLNAFSQELMNDLNAVLDEIELDPTVRVIVVTGNGPAFSAGGDLKQFNRMLMVSDFDGVLKFINLTARTLTRLEENPRPVIAAVNGTAVAGGLEMILCCDIVMAAKGTTIGDGHLKYGVLPGAGGSARLVRKVPHNVASRMLLTGELFPAEHLQRWGLIDDVVDAETLYKTAAERAAQLTSLSPLALSHVKRVAREASTRPASEGLRLELDAFKQYVTSHDFREGMDAFNARRVPEFLGE